MSSQRPIDVHLNMCSKKNKKNKIKSGLFSLPLQKECRKTKKMFFFMYDKAMM